MFKTHVLDPFNSVLNQFGLENAFCINETFYDYNYFAKKVSGIRKALQNFNNRGAIIGIIANDDVETYASIFAIWLEGLAYVPLNPDQPRERIIEIIKQAEVNLLLDSSKSRVFGDQATIMTSVLEDSSPDFIPVETSDDSLAYMLFTSGSTGTPKGVPITRGSLGSFMSSFWDVGFEIDHNDRCLQCFDLTFDISVQSYLVPLTRGACVYTIPHDQIKYSYAYGLLEDHKLTFGAMAPSMIRFLRPYFSEISIPSMRYNILGAEASPVDLILEWSECIPNAEIYNFYGPTEVTIYCTYYKFSRDSIRKQLNGLLSIGKPMKGIKEIIIDSEKNVLGINQKGELCVSGTQVSPGYWKNEEKNKLSFFEMTLNGVPHRFYRTGDLCFIDNEGDILYSGRMDYQVKIQGHRIELGEIEHYARSGINGKNAIAAIFENNTGNNEIALFVEDESVESRSLMEYLKLKMPLYMIPSKIICLKEFPLNSNGKIDRKKLQKLMVQ